MSTKFATLLLFLLIAGIPLHAHAQTDNRTILVLVKNTPGAPTPAQLVDYSNTWPHAAPPPLQAFNVKDPQSGDFLLPDRATGDFLAWLQANPNSARRKLEDYALMVFPSVDDIPVALAALLADPYVEDAAEPLAMDFHTGSSGSGAPKINPVTPLDSTQYGWDDMNIAAAWQLTGGGYALVAQIDMGLDQTHPALTAFNGATYIGGNFLPAASKDVGLTGQPAQPGFDPSNVDEGKAEFIPASPCTAVDAFLPPDHLGHGTHTAGLLGANSASGLGVQGTCKHCGISVYRAAFLKCYSAISPPQVAASLNSNAVDRSNAEAIDTGTQAINQSFGGGNASGSYNCVGNRTKSNCLTIAYAVGRDAAIVASSGNERWDLDFPASERRVISGGGFQPDLALWDDSPGNIVNCPPEQTQECGSNHSVLHNGQYFTHQELLGSAKRVLSTTYPNTTWVDYAECGDSYGTPSGDGVGWCTGTSMSAPQIAGVIGLLRSVNPLVPVGEPEPPIGSSPGLRTVLAQTASQSSIGQPWSPLVGYGIPDVAAAARRMLGKVAGGGVRNRATPLFRLYSAYAKDFAETTSPQYALSLMIAQAHQYVQPAAGLGAEPLVPGYAFPYDVDDPSDFNDTYESPSAAPRASIYVLTTDVNPRNEWPALLPLHLMDKPKASGRDYLLVTNKQDIEYAHGNGYNLRTIQGYIYQACTPEPACMPPAAEALYRACKTVDSDCATFLESERAAFEANGYTAAYPPGTSTKLGYAYPATDSDGDGLPDGFEYVVGSSPTRSDSDGDGIADAVEFPLAGVPVSDPCGGGTDALYCPADSIFKNGFDGF